MKQSRQLIQELVTSLATTYCASLELGRGFAFEPMKTIVSTAPAKIGGFLHGTPPRKHNIWYDIVSPDVVQDSQHKAWNNTQGAELL